jgi:hypothetical protein
MANTLTNILPKVLARGLLTLRETCVMPRLVNSDYTLIAAKKGSTIDVPVPTAVATRNVTPSQTPPANVDYTPGLVQVQLNNWKQSDPIGLTDNEMQQIDAEEHFLPMALQEGVRSLARDVNASILAEYKSVYGFYGATNTIPFNAADKVLHATQIRALLNKQLCPRTGRYGVVNMDAEANMLALEQFSSADKVMSKDVIIEGEIGRKYGIDWVAEDAIPVHTAGTASAATVTEISNSAVGATSVTLKVSASTATLVVGDVLTFANHAQQYAVTGAATLDTTGVVVGITPALVAAVNGSSTPVAVTVKASHTVNLAFHRDAFAFATRPLSVGLVTEGGSMMMTMQDPKSKLIMRLEVKREHKQTAWEFDILWGVKCVRPEFAARIIGQI